MGDSPIGVLWTRCPYTYTQNGRTPTHKPTLILPDQQCHAALEALWERRREELSAEGVKGEVDFCRRVLAYLDERLR